MASRVARYAWFTVAVAVVTLVAKSVAAVKTGSVGLFSDALESTINLVTALMLVVVLRIAKAPPDPDHPWGHDKAEYFANGVQGTLILLAGLGIVGAATQRFLEPQLVVHGILGLSLAAGSGLINFGAARYLRIRARRLRSSALQGESEHLMADVWTSVAVIFGVGLSYYTGIAWLDPLVAILVSLAIFATGSRLVGTFVHGLMDHAVPEPSMSKLIKVLESYKGERGIDYHALRTRVSGARIFVSVHILVPGAWSVTKGHALLDELESSISEVLEGVTVLTHLEPLEESCSFEDIEIASLL